MSKKSNIILVLPEEMSSSKETVDSIKEFKRFVNKYKSIKSIKFCYSNIYNDNRPNIIVINNKKIVMSSDEFPNCCGGQIVNLDKILKKKKFKLTRDEFKVITKAISTGLLDIQSYCTKEYITILLSKYGNFVYERKDSH